MIRSPNNGFTLVELLTTITIGAIVVAIAVPSFRTAAQNNQLVAQINTLNGIFKYARSSAVKLKQVVTVCASNDQATCNNTNSWEQGWVVFSTDSGNVDTLLKAGEPGELETSIRASNFNDNSRIVFAASGSLSNNDSRGTFTICDQRGNTSARALVINAVGRTQKSYDQNDDDIVENDSGVNIICPT